MKDRHPSGLFGPKKDTRDMSKRTKKTKLFKETKPGDIAMRLNVELTQEELDELKQHHEAYQGKGNFSQFCKKCMVRGGPFVAMQRRGKRK